MKDRYWLGAMAAVVAIVVVAAGCVHRTTPYVHTVGPGKYWNAHCDQSDLAIVRGGYCMIATDSGKNGRVFRVFKLNPHDTTSTFEIRVPVRPPADSR